MSFYKEVPGRQTTLESTLKFDTKPTEGSTNPVTSDGVKGAIDGAVGDASEALQEQIDEIAEKAGSGYTPKGPASVATLNGLTGQENGWLYTMTDAGTLTDGSLAVVAGDTVAWDEANSVWYKAMDYAPRQYGTNEVHNLPNTITAFRTGDVIPVDGPQGTAKMSKDDLLRVTAENVVDNLFVGDKVKFSATCAKNHAAVFAYSVKMVAGHTYRLIASSSNTIGATCYILVSRQDDTDYISIPMTNWGGSEFTYDYTPNVDIDLGKLRVYIGQSTDASVDVVLYVEDVTQVSRIDSLESGLSDTEENVQLLKEDVYGNVCDKTMPSKANAVIEFGTYNFRQGVTYKIELSAASTITSSQYEFFVNDENNTTKTRKRLDTSGSWDGSVVSYEYTAASDFSGRAFIWAASGTTANVNTTLKMKVSECVDNRLNSLEGETDALNDSVFGNEEKQTICDKTMPSKANAAIEFGTYNFKNGHTYRISISAVSSITTSLYYFYVNDSLTDTNYTKRRLDSSGSWDGSEVTYEYTATSDFSGRVFIWASSGTTLNVGTTVFILDLTGYNQGLEKDVAEKATLVIKSASERRALTPANGDMCYDTDAKELCVYDVSDWFANRKSIDITNPLLDEVADPDFVEVDGVFYIVHSLATNVSDIGAVGLLSTRDWKNFERINPVFTDGPITENYWAPDIDYINGKFVIYCSANSPRRLIAYTADDAEGPWTYEGVLVGTGGQIPVPATTTPIDPEVGYDHTSGKRYLFFGSYIDSSNGKQYAVELSADGLTCATGASAQEVASIAGEGATVLYHDGYYYLICSIGDWGYSSYHCVYGRSTSLLGPYVNKDGQQMLDGYYEQLWGTGKTTYIYGRGHGGTFFTDKNGRHYMPVHAWKAGESQGDGDLRQLCLFEIKFTDDGWLSVDDSTSYQKFLAPNL